MGVFETVTFGASGLDRAAQLRGNPEALAATVRDSGAVVLPMWRGRPLFSDAQKDSLVWLQADGPVLPADTGRIFLGLADNGQALFAQTVSDWCADTAKEAASHGNFDGHTYTDPRMPTGTVWADLRSAMTCLSARDAELAATARGLFGWHEIHGYCARCGAKSDMDQQGWQRRCPSCTALHFPRTDPVVIMLITRGNSVLLGRSPGWPEGFYSLLAGFMEPGETVESAVRREVMEEAGIAVGDVSYITSQPWPFPASLMLGCQGQALSDEITVDATELDDAVWVTREDVMAAFAGTHSWLKPARPGAIAQYLLAAWVSGRI